MSERVVKKRAEGSEMTEEEKNIRNIRYIAASMIERAQSGHPGASLSLVPLLNIMYGEIIRIHKDYQESQFRDIVIISNGHACPTQYAFLVLHGFLEIDELKQFRKLNSRTPGHPEVFTPGVEASTGPLGQGIANGVGFAISLKKIGSNAKVYVIFGDGCYQEGISHEAFALAANLHLDNIIFIYDSNQITIDGSTELSMNENAEKRFEAFNFEIFSCQGEDTAEIRRILLKEQNAPKVLILHTRIAEGVSKVGHFLTHGQPLGPSVVEELKDDVPEFCFNQKMVDAYEKRVKENLEFFENAENKNESTDKKNIPNSSGHEQHLSQEHIQGPSDNSKETQHRSGNISTQDTVSKQPIRKFRDVLKEVSETAKAVFLKYEKTTETKATREFIADALDDLRFYGIPFIGGSADLAITTLTRSHKEDDLNRHNYDGTYIRYGIREHAMCSILNGITFHGFFKAFGSTFLEFLGYGFPAVRMAAMGKIPNLYLCSHDSIGVGEDGPAHQPIEMLSLLRATLNLYVLRPCDGLESRFSIWFGLTRTETPTIVCFTRQKIPAVPETSIEGLMKGAYFLMETENPDLTLISSGSEVPVTLGAARILQQKNIRISVISMLCFELFEEQTVEYKRSLLRSPMIISIEASSTFGWSRYAHHSIGVRKYGRSANHKDVFDHYGFTPEKIAEKILRILEENKK